MKVGLLTKEWPPEVYGGAGVHVVNLTAALRTARVDVEVHCFGSPRDDARAYQPPSPISLMDSASAALVTDLLIAEQLADVDLIHSHTWYTNMAGHWGAEFHKKPHVITAHSLEPLRPWKAEQLGEGYKISSWAERTAFHGADAVIAVSDGMKRDVLSVYPDLDPSKVHTVRNGIDTSIYKPKSDPSTLQRFGINFPYAIFVGRITRQKGLAHLLRAWRNVPHDLGLVLAASSPDEPQIGREVEALISELQRERKNVIWIKEMVSQADLIALLSSARVALVPSVYEPLGIVNLEAMACGTPVVASDVGGIPEVVAHNQTGVLVHFDDDHTRYERELAEAIAHLGSDENLANQYGAAGRAHVERLFSWSSVAEETIAIYRRVLSV